MSEQKNKSSNTDLKVVGAIALFALIMIGSIVIASSGQPQSSGGGQIMGVSRAEAERILSQQMPQNAGKVMGECARKIASRISTRSAGEIPAPSYKDFSNGEFVYSWSNIFGRSASCSGTLQPFVVEYVTLNGKEIR